MRRVVGTGVVLLGLWAVALALVVVPTPNFGLVGLAVNVAWWAAAVRVSVLLGATDGSRAVTVVATTATLLLAATLLNWNSVAPGTWFRTHRWLYDHAAATAAPGDSYYGSALPFHLQPLSVDGRVSAQGSALFFPQWIGFPDDAGGYFYSPYESPYGFDMYGSLCETPTSLGEGWWMCGM